MTVLSRVRGVVHTVRTSPKDRGATAAEYAIMASLIAVVIVAAVTTIGVRLLPIFTSVAGSI